MTLKMFSIYDSKCEAFIQPFFSQATGSAIRSFETAVNEEGHAFNSNAGDYTLFELGEFEQNTAAFNILATPLNLGVAIQFLKASGRSLEAVENVPARLG